jgi:hypothetical protein
MEDFMKDMETKVGQPLTKDDLPDDETPKSIPYEDWDETEALVMPERDDYDITTCDPYMHSYRTKVLRRKPELASGSVILRAISSVGALPSQCWILASMLCGLKMGRKLNTRQISSLRT